MSRILITGHRGFIGSRLYKAIQGHEVVGCDLGDSEITGPFDGIVHLAAVSRVSEAEKDMAGCMDTNVVLTAGLLSWKPKWFILASTCEPPTNVYGLSKRMAEDLVKLKSKSYIILRISNVYGEGMAKDKLLPMLRAGEVKKLHECVLPFEYVHVDTVVEQFLQAIRMLDESTVPVRTAIKLCNGVAKTKEDLLSVANSY